jgi:D-alanyl-D-alanine carboxypeptidase/D-alanyl-D-alanine-endopeptidase (penicillin-binding protein 4)
LSTRVCTSLAATRQRVEAHVHFLQRERLDQVVVGAGIEPGQLVVQRIARGEHQHRGLLARLVAQLAADLQAVHAGQVEVEHDRVEVVHHRQVQAGHAVGGEVDGMPAILEVVAEVGGDVAELSSMTRMRMQSSLRGRALRCDRPGHRGFRDSVTGMASCGRRAPRTKKNAWSVF